jgi:ABC-type transporter Mla subunit MlaD
MHPYMKFLRDAYDRDRIYGEESKKEARAMLMLQMASNLSQPGATVGRAFDNLAPLVAAQGQERRRSDENTRNVLSEISLAMHRGEIDLTDSETRNMIGVANALSRERESKANVTRANRGGRNELKSYELAMKTALAEVGGYRNEKNEEKYQELLAKYLTEFSRFDA